MSQEWTREDWQRHQRKVILEEYMEHLAVQKREVRNAKSTVDRASRVVQAGQRERKVGA